MGKKTTKEKTHMNFVFGFFNKVFSHIWSRKHRGRLKNPLNFVRFFYWEIFDKFDKILHLDPDLTVQGDISELEIIKRNQRKLCLKTFLSQNFWLISSRRK